MIARFLTQAGASQAGASPGATVAQGPDHSGGPWVYLFWLGFLLLPLQRGVYAPWWATAAAAAAFLVVHFWGFLKTGPSLWIARVAMFGIGIALFPYNPFAHTFFMYAGMPGARANDRESIIIIVLTVAGSYGYFTWQHMSGIYFGLVSVIVIGLGVTILRLRANRKAQTVLAGKDLEIARLAKIAERERIARDLHDLLGHTLSVIAIKAELAHKLLGMDGTRAATEMREVAEVARKALAEVRQAIVGLRNIGLLDATRAVDTMLRAAGLETTLNVQAPLPALTPAQENALAQAVLEAGTNIVRHANASRASISILCRQSRVTIEVDDNGRGGTLAAGHGLTGMRERLTALSGELQLHTLEPGTRLIAALPLAS
jgi:two-component system sensor histidine kinase DesK